MCGARAHGGDHRAHDGETRAVAADLGDAGAGMGGFEPLHERAVVRAIERRAERRQPPHGVGRFAGQDVDGGGIAQAVSGGEGVGGVKFGGVADAQRRGHAALSPGRGAAFADRRGAQHQHGPRRGGERGGKTRQPGADHDHTVEGSRDPTRPQISSTSTWWRALTMS